MKDMNANRTLIKRERALLEYSLALENGDDTTIERILEMAAQDAALEEMIFAMHDHEVAQEIQNADAASAAKVRELLAIHLPSAQFNIDDELEELPPVTVADVVARIQTDATQRLQARALLSEADRLQQQGSALRHPLPPKLDQRSLRHFFSNLGMNLSAQFEKCFRETALFLNMGRQQSQAQLAATRRQRKATMETHSVEQASPTSLKDKATSEVTPP